MTQRLDEQTLRAMYKHAADVEIRSQSHGDAEHPYPIVLMFCSGMADMLQIHQFAQWLEQAMGQTAPDEAECSKKLREYGLEQLHGLVNVDLKLFAGHLIIYLEHADMFFSLDVAQPPHRNPEESNTEVSIRGPRDAFTEEISMNVALIRKRLRTNSLSYERFTIGERSQTSVALLYIRDIANKDVIDEARKRLNGIRTDALLSSGQLEEMLADAKYPLFPLLTNIGRPDFVADSLIRGRFAVIVEGSPMAVIAPNNLTEALVSPEDMHLPFYFVNFEKALRLIGLLISTMLPGFWIAISAFQLDQIPFPLLATISSGRLGLPLSGPIDFFLMLGVFELFREAGIRLPKAVGQTVAVVGGLIIGDAAIRAGFTSPTTLVVSATTAVTTFTLVNQSLSGAVSLLRFFVLAVSAIFGMFGFFVSVFGIVLYLSTLTSFGVPYLSPLSPPIYREWPMALGAKPWKRQKKRPVFLSTKDDTRQPKDDGE